jgi:site-specific recombinase
MTTNLKYFSGLALLFSITFFYFLHSDLKAESYENIWWYAVMFGVYLFISGLLLGYKDSVRETKLDLGYRYHLMTFIIVNAVGLISLLIFFGINRDSLISSGIGFFFWAIGLFVHYRLSSKTIKGMDKDKIFD